MAPSGWCLNKATGQWEWVLASQCAEPVQAGTPIDRDHVPSQDTPKVLDVTAGSPMTRSMVDRLFDANSKAYYERETTALKALAKSLPLVCQCGTDSGPCPGYKGRGTTAATIPGTFEVLGVPFSISEPGLTKSPRFDRTYTPNNEQRIMIEGRIVRRSNELFGEALTNAVIAKWGKASGTVNPRTGYSDGFNPGQVIAELSVQQALDIMPRWTMTYPGMAIRSAPVANEAELNGKGGLLSWLKRGFLISHDVADAQVKLNSDAVCPDVCTSQLCRVPHWVDGLPACIATGIPTTQGTQGGCFWIYASVQQDGQMTLTLKHDDPSWLQKVGDKLASIMTAIGNTFCSIMPTIKTQTDAVAKTCLDKDNKPCAKGVTGCVDNEGKPCVGAENATGPSAAAVGGAGMFYYALAAYGCSQWTKEQQKFDPKVPLPPVPDPVAPTKRSWLRLIPWALGGLAAGVGAVFATKR